MDYKKYYEARDTVVEIMRKDWLGPVKDDEILCDENPLNYYIVGKLYPINYEKIMTQSSPVEDLGSLDEEETVSGEMGREPSSLGLSFSLNAEAESFYIDLKAAVYRLTEREKAKEILNFDDADYKTDALFWKREALPFSKQKIDVNELLKKRSIKLKLSEEDEIVRLSARIILHKIYEDGSKTVSVTVINETAGEKGLRKNAPRSVFQPKITITSDFENAFGNIRRNASVLTEKDLEKDPETAELEMLYSRVSDFASGHGCAVRWDTDENGRATILQTEFLPEYELKQMMPTLSFRHKILQMKYLAEGNPKEISEGLQLLLAKYREWIDLKEKEAKELEIQYQKAAERNINKCRETLKVLDKSVKKLDDPDVFRAFTLANKAMFLQREKMLKNTNRYESDEKITWYPFQLAFFLQEIISFSEPHSEERKKVDLLWFPTGGGKTEAYLGIAAFAIFLRRLRYGDDGDGTAVMTKYTLRLLSFQQFERASALICACELVRQREGIPGGEIGIGLWVGEALTPNKIESAQKILNGVKDFNSPSSNPVQFEKCPWCGHELTKENYCCNPEKKRMLISCENPDCEFHRGLPVYLIDEEIYHYTPTFIVSTVDKFAQVALNSDIAPIFGKKIGKLPPELIIQDELHLIAGPLGTITALYEAAINKLCEKDGVLPKVVASTATIKNAKEQIRGLYATEFTQFPPQGIDITDSFFAELSTKDRKPARFYMGCMAVGTSPTTMMIRVMSSLLYATRYLISLGYDEDIIDSFWTQTDYFNTLRELGGAIIRVVDDIQDRFSYLRNTKFGKMYPLGDQQKRYDLYKELTSREKSENIGNVIQKELYKRYTKDHIEAPYDFLLSSNMISVGIDVSRLNTMIVVGQPKTTSEYIQATSRIGRETPGLVIATYNQAKSRDRSHYEDFLQYHGAFYKYVEATGITPFSDRARDRVLQTLYVILCRYEIPELFEDTGAANFKRDLDGLDSVRNYILDYVDKVDPDETENVSYDLDEIEEEWEYKARRCETLRYRRTPKMQEKEALFEPDYKENDRFRVLNSMRSVETSVKIITKE